jgi:sialic acid synthase SpsE
LARSLHLKDALLRILNADSHIQSPPDLNMAVAPLFNENKEVLMKKSFIIAEISSNHMGNMDLASKMIEEASKAGADFVKFQSWQEKTLIPSWKDREWYKQTELTDDNHKFLIDVCNKNNVEFLTTCFDRKRIGFLSSLGLKYIKVASTDLASYTMLKEIRDAFEFPIVSTGMSKKEEIENASTILSRKGDFAFLHCVSIYPTPIEKLNLKKMEWLKQFTSFVGLSDHSLGIEGAQIALSRGASFIEKHFTLHRSLPGKDHRISILPEQLKALCDFRDLIEKADGELNFELSKEELEVRDKFIGRWGDNK